MKICHKFSVLFVCLSICFTKYSHGLEESYRDKFAPVVKESNLFAFDLYHQLKQQTGNLFFSPYNIDVAFSMTLMGARENTESEMRRVLYFPDHSAELRTSLSKFLFDNSSASKNPDQFMMSSALWVQEGFPFLPEFQKTMQNDYRATIQNVNFEDQPLQAVQVVNQWVTKMTGGKINQLLTTEDVSAQTRLVLTSAIYMKDQWSNTFDQKQTARAALQNLFKID